LCIKETFMVKNICKVSVLTWLVLLLFVFSCEKEVKKLLRIRVEPHGIYIAEKEITRTAAVAKQDTLIIEALDTILRNKREAENALVLIQIEPSVSYGVLFKIVNTIGILGFTDVNITSRINGKHDTESVYLPKRLDLFESTDENGLKLSVGIYKYYFEIWAGGSSLPKIPVVNPIDFTYEELAMDLAEVRNRFINSQGIDEIIIFAEDDVRISNIIQAMHIAGKIGFDKKKLHKIVTSFQPEEDSIRKDEEFKATQIKMDSLFNLGLDTSSLAKLYVENKVIPDFRDTSIALNYAKYLIRERIQSEKIKARVDSLYNIRKRRQMPTVDVKPM